MFSIGEFARLGDVSIRTLRHYDEIGLLRPAKVDPATGYRGYSADQLGRLNRIMAMKELGFSLTQARRLLDGVTPDELRGMLILRRAQLEREVEEHKNQLLGIEARLRHIEKEDAMPADDIVVKKIPAMGVAVPKTSRSSTVRHNCSTAVPTPPAAMCTSTRSPGRMPATRNSMRWAVR